MKMISRIVLAGALGGLAFSAQAERDAAVDLAGCESELRAYYGEETAFEVVEKRRHRYGTKVRMSVRMDADNSRFATCWVPGNDIAGFEEEQGETRVASTGGDQPAR